MTRLAGMPYDTNDARRELALLETALRKSLVQRLTEAKAAGVNLEKLRKFAELVLKKEASVVTFNYDDVLDEALWNVRKATNDMSPEPYWHPDGGYGFYCRPSGETVADTPGFMDRSRSLLLKLHGSVNWRSRLGEGTPRGPASLLHHEEWLPRFPRWPGALRNAAADHIEAHLEPDPFIVPPVLVKAELSVHPVLRVIWELARERLSAATSVVFIGYSLPVTDLASQTLFRETLLNRATPDVQIVNLCRDASEEGHVKDTYRSLVPTILDGQFHFSGAENWVDQQTV
jgi:hypothetical protein